MHVNVHLYVQHITVVTLSENNSMCLLLVNLQRWSAMHSQNFAV